MGSFETTGYLLGCLLHEAVSSFAAIVDGRVDLSVPLELCKLEGSYENIRWFVSQKYGLSMADSVMRRIRNITGDLTPSGKVNLQASRDRLEHITAIVKRTGGAIELPTRELATMATTPIHVRLEEALQWKL